MAGIQATKCCCQAIGGCCLTTGDCVDTTQAQCDAFNGTFLGVGNGCTFGSCDGACCVPANPPCIEGVNVFECQGMFGTFQGPGSTCDPDPCEQPCDIVFCTQAECDLCGCTQTSYIVEVVFTATHHCGLIDIPYGQLTVQQVVNKVANTCAWQNTADEAVVSGCIDTTSCDGDPESFQLWLTTANLNCNAGSCSVPPEGIWRASLTFREALCFQNSDCSSCFAPSTPSNSVEGCYPRLGCPTTGPAPQTSVAVVPAPAFTIDQIISVTVI